MPFTPSMKLNALTNPMIHTVTTITPAASTAGGRFMRPASTAAMARPATPCSSSRRRAGSPVRSSAKPMAANAATATAKVIATVPCISSSAANTRPTAIGAPPPRGVGTLCDDRSFGTSTAARRSSGISTGSAAVTKAAHISAAKTLVRSPGTSQDTSGGNNGP
jgi:hypothetical protein